MAAAPQKNREKRPAQDGKAAAGRLGAPSPRQSHADSVQALGCLQPAGTPAPPHPAQRWVPHTVSKHWLSWDSVGGVCALSANGITTLETKTTVQSGARTLLDLPRKRKETCQAKKGSSKGPTLEFCPRKPEFRLTSATNHRSWDARHKSTPLRQGVRPAALASRERHRVITED